MALSPFPHNYWCVVYVLVTCCNLADKATRQLVCVRKVEHCARQWRRPVNYHREINAFHLESQASPQHTHTQTSPTRRLAEWRVIHGNVAPVGSGGGGGKKEERLSLKGNVAIIMTRSVRMRKASFNRSDAVIGLVLVLSTNYHRPPTQFGRANRRVGGLPPPAPTTTPGKPNTSTALN